MRIVGKFKHLRHAHSADIVKRYNGHSAVRHIEPNAEERVRNI